MADLKQDNKDPIVIIGNGAAANSAAETIRAHDSERPVMMIARESFPLYSACALPDSLSGWAERDKVFLKKLPDYAAMDIVLRAGCEVSRIEPADRRIIMHSIGSPDAREEAVSYGQLILATGSRPIIPPVPGSGLAGNFVVKSIADIDAIEARLPRQAVVVGSGNIGIEMAEALEMRGCQVAVVEMMERIFPRIFDSEPSRRIAEILQEHGIEILTGEKVLEVGGSSEVEYVRTDRRRLECDTVIWAAGVRQNVELARDAGADIGGQGGIRVDEFMKTSLDDIYACGDCIESVDMLTGSTGLSLLWPNARRQGEVAALNILGHAVSYEGAVSLVMEDIYGTTAVSMGKTSSELAGAGTAENGQNGKSIRIIEGESGRQYWRVTLVDDRIMGLQALNVTTGLGAVMALMKKRITLTEYRAALADSATARTLAWYLPAQRLLEDIAAG